MRWTRSCSQLEPDCWREADEMLHDPEVRIVALFGVNPRRGSRGMRRNG